MKTYAVNNSSGHTFYVMAADGSAPDREQVNKACLDIGGRLVHPGAIPRPPVHHADTFEAACGEQSWACLRALPCACRRVEGFNEELVSVGSGDESVAY